MFTSRFFWSASWLLFVSASVSSAAPSPTPTATPQTIFNRPVGGLAADPVRSRVYATVPSDNAVIVVDTVSLTVTRTIFIGSIPQGLAISADRSKLWVANSGSTNFAIGIIDLNTLQTLPSFSAPVRPRDIDEGAGHLLYVTRFGASGIMQINGDTGAFLTAFDSSGFSFLEISPDRGLLYVASEATLKKYNVATATPSLVQQANNLGSGLVGVRVSHDGQLIVIPHRSGNGGSQHMTYEIPTANIMSVNGIFDVGEYPLAAIFSNDDTLLYHAADTQSAIKIFNTATFLQVGAIPLENIPDDINDLVIDRSGRWLFVATVDFQGNGDLRVHDTGRSDPLPGGTPLPTPTPLPTVTPTPSPTPTASPIPTATPQIIFNHAIGHLAADPVRSRIYATVPGDNAVIVVDTASLTVTQTIPIGASPQGLSISANGLKLWVANSGSTSSAVGVVDLNTLQTLPSFSAPERPYDIEEGAGHRLYLTPFSSGQIMRIDGDTGTPLTSFGSLTEGSLLELSPDRGLLYAGTQGSLYKYNVAGATPSQVQVASNLGGNLAGLRVSHDGRLTVIPHGGGNGGNGYVTFEIPTANIASVDGSLNVDAFPAAATFSNDDTLLYHAASIQNAIKIFNTATFLQVGTIPMGISFTDINDVVLDRSGRWLFVATSDFPSGGDLRVFDTGRSDELPTPSPTPTGPPVSPTPSSTPVPTPTPMPTPSPTPVHTPTPTPIPTPTPTPSPSPSATPAGLLGNLSTRLLVETGDNVLIGGFIVTGTQPKKVIVRAIGPSLPVAGALADPVLELRDTSGSLIASNDNWRSDQEADILATTIAPTNDLESAIVATLPANNSGYTATVRGVDNGTGIGLVEVYDLNQLVDSKLGNISTRGLVQTDENVLIAGTIVLGPGSRKVLVRAIGPSLPVAGKLADPVLELRNGDGTLLRSNDNWRSDQEAEIMATTIPPTDDLEAAIVQTLPGNGAAYTAIVRGVNDTTGVALVEVYALP